MGEGIEEERLWSHRKGFGSSAAFGGAVGAATGDCVAGRAHGEGGCRKLHVDRRRRCQLEGLELLQLLVQSPVLVRQRLAAFFQ